MNKPVERSLNKAVDSIQETLTHYACDLNYESLSPEAIHAAKVRVIDTLGVLIGAFPYEPCRIARNLAAKFPNPYGATVIGTRMKVSPDMAAFVNATTARYMQFNDLYNWPGSYASHPSDVVTPILAAAEHAQVSGREFLTGIILGYEVFLRFCDVFHNSGFDNTNFCCLGSALAAGKVLGLSRAQLSHCIAMAAVPNNILTQTRGDFKSSDGTVKSMFKVVASGQAARAGVFAALLARAGMEGPHLPFEGESGWCRHVARERVCLDPMGGNGMPFKILHTQIKNRPSTAFTIASILAAEKVAPALKNVKDVARVTVEVYKIAMKVAGTRDHLWCWDPQTRESADQSIPYLVGVALMDGTVNQRSYDEVHLGNRDLRALMQKIDVVENEDFTRANERLPMEYRSRVTVLTSSGEHLCGESGGDEDDMGKEKSDEQIVEKFRSLTEDFFGTKRVDCFLERLWHLEDLEDVAEIPPAFVLD